MAAEQQSVVEVAGDPTVDWMLVLPPDAAHPGMQVSYRWDRRASVGLAALPGGAALLTSLLDHLCTRSTPALSATVRGVQLSDSCLNNPRDTTITRVFSLWSAFARRRGSAETAWRVREFLGQQPAERPSPPASRWTDRPAPRVLVLDDTNHGFRDSPAEWPACLRNGPPPEQIVLKMASPLASGPLWELLAAEHADRLTLYIAVGDLRKEYAPIGQPLSWERTSRDVVKAVQAHPALMRAARVIVSLSLSGAVVLERDGGSSLVFDPGHQEGDWEGQRLGMPFTAGTCIAAALATASLCGAGAPDWTTAVERGLAAARAVHEHGFTLRAEAEGSGLAFPFDTVARAIAAPCEATPFRCVGVPPDDRWHLLGAAFPAGYRAAAETITVEGISAAARDLPVERMGAWASVDRAEIESMRSVRNIVREYLHQPRRVRPLSLAAFGPPGAGKSFAIKQMAGEWARDGAAMTVLEFNVSQFAGMDALAIAFQRVRDCAVEQTLPLVFWDEFDTPREGRELGWLAQFLAPMQDGAFLDDGVLRPIGPAIFVFAGGTHATMASFKARAAELPGAKATDFLSRLRGYVDILGPNPSGPSDVTYLLRRAFLLRPLLERRAPQLIGSGRLNIDPGVLRAFLDVTTYVHGARSMESIVEMSALSDKLRYERSALPAQHQLGLHVDADEFLALVGQEAPL